MIDLSQNRQPHRRFGVVPRVDDAAIIPGDRAVIALQVEDAYARAIEEAGRNFIAPGEMRHACAAPLAK